MFTPCLQDLVGALLNQKQSINSRLYLRECLLATSDLDLVYRSSVGGNFKLLLRCFCLHFAGESLDSLDNKHTIFGQVRGCVLRKSRFPAVFSNRSVEKMHVNIKAHQAVSLHFSVRVMRAKSRYTRAIYARSQRAWMCWNPSMRHM
jgi:hypothetical protein